VRALKARFTQDFPRWSPLHDFEKQVLDVSNRYSLQTAEINWLDEFLTKVRKLLSDLDIDGTSILEKVEHCAVFAWQMSRANSFVDYTCALSALLSSMFGTSLTRLTTETFAQRFADIFSTAQEFVADLPDEFEAQSAEEFFMNVREKFDFFTSLADLPIMTKMYKLLLHILSNSLLEPLGVTFASLGYTKFEEEAVKRAHGSKFGFWHSLFDSVSMFCVMLTKSVKQGSWQPFLHNATSYEAWCTEAFDLKGKAQFIGNPEAVGFDYFEFRQRLDDAIENGEAIKRHIPTNKRREFDIVRNICADLSLIKDTMLTRSAAQASRAAPYGILLSGGSSIGKSNFCEILFTYFGQLFGHPVTSEYKYTRNFNDAFWSGWTTSKWCIVLDDVAALHTRFQTPEPTIQEVIQVLNNTAFVPNQAELADKGRTPVLAKLVVATSNTTDMNASNNYGCPLAIQRRLPIVVKLRPKLQYARDDSREMLDPAKLVKAAPGCYDDYWHITVCKVVQDGEGIKSQRAKHVVIGVYDDIHDFLEWFAGSCVRHNEQQESLRGAHQDMAAIEVCKGCYRPQTLCKCLPIPEGLEIVAPPLATIPEEEYEAFLASPEPDIAPDDPDQVEEHTYERQSLEETIDTATAAVQVFRWTATAYGAMTAWFTVATAVTAHLFMLFYLLRGHIIVYCYRRFGMFVRASAEEAKRAAITELRMLGMCMADKLAPLKAHGKVFAATAGIFAIVVGAYKISHHFRGDKKDATRETTTAPIPQSELLEVGARPNPKEEERVNVWYNEVLAVTAFDVAPGSSSWKGLAAEKVEDLLQGGVVRLRMHRSDGKIRSTGALALGSWLYAVNLHAVPDDDSFLVEIIQASAKEGVNANLEFLLSQTSIMRFPERDLAIIVIKKLPPRRDISSILVRPTFTGRYIGKYLVRTKEGFITGNKVVDVKPQTFAWVTDKPTPVWAGVSETLTVNGDCGAPLLAYTPTGPVILGIHAAGNPSQSVVSTPIYKEDVEAAQTFFGGYAMQSGEPMLNSDSAPVVAVVPVHVKSPLRYFREGNANVYGSLTGPRARPKSCVVRTAMANAAEEHGYKQKFGPPVLSGWLPWRLAYQDMLQIPTAFRADILQAATRGFTRDILNLLHPEDLAEVMVYDMFTAINGAPGVAYVDKLQRNTSMGFPWNRSKKYYLTALPMQHGVPDPVAISKEVLDRSQIILDNYEKGIRAMPVFKAHLKDEPTSFKKIAACKTRLFGGAPVDWALVVRMYLLSFIRLVQNNRFIFESAPGTVAQSSEWGEIRSYLTHFGTDRIVAGDYKAFDKSMPPEFILAAFEIIIEVCRAAGFTELQLQVIWGIGTDTAYPLYDVNGDLVEFFGSEPSGHNLTVIINGLVNCLYMRYAYIVLNPLHECESFKDNAHLMTYGDDNVLGVSRGADWFNHTSIQAVLADHGVTYTMADKEAATVPFIPIHQVSFLKRTWRYDEDLKDYLCPLEHESIEKMLITCVASKSVSREYQGISAISSAVQEYFFYGKRTFVERKQILEEIAHASDLTPFIEDSTFPTWTTLAKRFLDYGAPKRWSDQLSKDRTRVPRPTREPASSERPRQKSPLPIGEVSEDDPDEVFTPQSLVQNTTKEGLVHCGMCQRHVEPREGLALAGGTCDSPSVAGGERQFLPQVHEQWSYVAQSEDTSVDVTGADSSVSETTNQTVSFLDEGIAYTVGSAAVSPPSATSDALSGAELGSFLSRPSQIATFTWLESDAVPTARSFNVWQLFFSNPNIQAKLQNYAWLRCDLRVKIMLNASPFYYGAMMAAYQPLPNFTPSTIVVDSGTRFLMLHSQRPHAWLYPQNNEGAEMTLPFFWPKNWITTNSNQDFLDMGVLNFFNFTSLASANGATGAGVTVSVYAWAENVTLSGPTVGLLLQSKDEYGKGPVSSVASAIAMAAKSLSRIPLIRPFATATQMGASSVAQAASALGYCNTPVIEDVRPFKPSPCPALASTEQGFPVEKLTIDPKNELSIDPAVVGLGPVDELHIASLVQRESYLCTTTWSSSQSVDTLLFQSAITPVMFDMNTLSSPMIYMTPAAWVAQMFQFWRGDVIFRFRFIATQYHRGRVRIVYDPSGTGSQNVSNTTATQVTCFNEVVDLTKDTNIEVRVPYSQALAWCKAFVPTSSTQIPWTTSTSSVFNHVPGTTNGQIVMRVVTDLTGPLATTSVPIIISVRGAENLEYAAPRDIFPRYSQYAAQSLTEYDATISTAVSTGGSSEDDPYRYLINHGEAVMTLRQLLRRSSFSTSVLGFTNPANLMASTTHTFHRLPKAYGYDFSGNNTAKGVLAPTVTFKFNMVANHPITWVSMAFVGTRGSVHWTASSVTGSITSAAAPSLAIARSTGLATYSTVVNSPSSLTTTITTAWLLKALRYNSFGGLAYTNTTTNAMVTASCPMYSAYKFQTTDKQNLTAPSSQDDSQQNAFVVQARTYCGGVYGFELYAAAGTDFNLHFFLNVPTLWVYQADPVPV
jgi:hypothetical protein